MRRESKAARLTLLERLDLVLAARLGERLHGQPEAGVQGTEFAMTPPPAHTLHAWIAAVLGLRGFELRQEDVAAVLGRTRGRFAASHQEHKLIVGLGRVLDEVVDHGLSRRCPDGWQLVTAFGNMTASLERFRNNELRRDHPWDGVLGVTYPPADQLPGLLDGFRSAACYGEVPAEFAALHPVRRAFRVLWRFARIAPFPDFNLIVGFVAMNQFLLAHGYPLLAPESTDRVWLRRRIAGPPPLRIVQLEARLLQSVS